MMPVAWVKTFRPGKAGKPPASSPPRWAPPPTWRAPGFRRLLVNACYWAVGLEEKIADSSDVELVGDYKPTKFGFGGFVKGRKPSDYAGE